MQRLVWTTGVLTAIVTGMSWGQGTVGTRPGAAGAAGAAAAGSGAGLAVKNLEKQLENPVTIDAEKSNLGEFIAALQRITQTNITVNWNALANAGLTRNTPVSLHLKDVSYEHVVKTLIDTLPVKNNDPSLRLNYLVGDNTLSITTNAEMGKGSIVRLYSLARPMALEGAAPADDKLATAIIRAELVRAGEPMDAPGHNVGVKDDTLASAVSERGHMLLGRLQSAFAAPTRPGQFPVGVAQTATSRRGQETAVRAAGGLPKMNAEWAAGLAKEPQKYAAQGVNVALMAGTSEELAKATPEIGWVVNDGGVVLVGPKAALQARTVFGAYDLRDVLRRQAARGARGGGGGAAGAGGGDVLTRVLEGVKAKVPGNWGTLEGGGKMPLVMVPYGTILVVFAPADVQRQVSAALAEQAR